MYLRESQIEKIRKMLTFGMRQFNTGHREEAIPTLMKVLEQVPKVPGFRLAAAGLLGESYRGMGDFLYAESYYRLALKECEEIPVSERPQNEWYNHYRPRTEIGLLVVLRRNISVEHEQISSRLKNARVELAYLNIPDLNAQLNLIEGLYFRQLGYIDDSIAQIQDGLELIDGVVNPIGLIFLEKMHFESLLILSYLIDPGNQILASKLARQSYNQDPSPWCTAVAAIALIHLEFRRIMEELDYAEKLDVEWIEGMRQKIENLLVSLRENAEFEKDPILVSEGLILELMWMGFTQNSENLESVLSQLVLTLEKACFATILLRTVELASISPLLDPLKNSNIFSQLCQEGIEKLTALAPNLLTYNCSESAVTFYSQLLRGERRETSSSKTDWNSPPLQTLRAIAWP